MLTAIVSCRVRLGLLSQGFGKIERSREIDKIEEYQLHSKLLLDLTHWQIQSHLYLLQGSSKHSQHSSDDDLQQLNLRKGIHHSKFQQDFFQSKWIWKRATCIDWSDFLVRYEQSYQFDWNVLSGFYLYFEVIVQCGNLNDSDSSMKRISISDSMAHLE